ncbi:hypothetical protein K493DRAFT_296961 [Basidiobolus meristosporus CBS 931.73]|uniref:Arrestin C-terminal-like domain-containing protein n=1 Tax=Basidiobolus meristosporus CBS 931.73 TaxID=1314790 RepID=A0A1Y1Z2J9_9FUNG|nr:hypothetical protein K493DRAFT_296961 [Basidiobolus meristosporus CBS 931.73]|eukprot:ORY04522.1 hypothetical protein K493DRAFT_296961 [Basidiobolus meristosporus CBS 931.73]
MGEVAYTLNVRVKRPTFTRDVKASKSLTLRRDSLVNFNTVDDLFSNPNSLAASLQQSIHFPIRAIVQGESIPLVIMVSHLIEHSINSLVISVREHVKYQSSVSAFQTVKHIARFHFKVYPDDIAEEKKVILNLSNCSVRFSCDTTYIQVEHELNIQFNHPTLQHDINIPIWLAPKELQTAYDELPPYSAGLSGGLELPTYDLVSQPLSQMVLSS